MWGQLRRSGRGVYIGHLTFEDPTRYHALLCGDHFDALGYPHGSILVQPVAPPRHSGSKSVGLSQGRALLAVVAIVGTAGVFVLRKLSLGQIAHPEADEGIRARTE
jgi:hypothetical protein